MSKTYSVGIPITAIASVEVEAENEEEAKKKALDAVELEHIGEWDAHQCICRGNVFYGLQNEIDVEELE